MPTRLPWMPFYGADFFGSERVRLMSHAERGLLLALLWQQWCEGSLPPVSPDICRLVSAGRIPERVLELFPVDDDGRRRNVRLEHIRAEQETYRQLQSEAGKRGAHKRWHGDPNSNPNGDPIATPLATPMAKGMANDSNTKPDTKPEPKNYNDDDDSVRVGALSAPMDPAGSSALEGYIRASHDPGRLLSELEAIVSGVHGPGGMPVPAEALGRALHAMQMVGVNKLSPKVLLGFCRRELEPEDDPPAGDKPGLSKEMRAWVAGKERQERAGNR